MNKNNENSNKNKKDTYNLLKVLTVILGFLLIIYFLVAIFITKEIDWGTKNKEASEVKKIEENTILVSDIFSQSEKIYYVYFYEFRKPNTNIDKLINNNLKPNYKVYKVNTGSAYNASYIDKEGNKEATTLEDIKIKNPTLIKFVSNNITEYYEGKDEILSYLK